MEQLYHILEKLPFMQGVDRQNILQASQISKPCFCEFAKGEQIVFPGQPTHALYVLCQGRASAFSADEAHTVMLRSFKPYETFGISNLFTTLPFATKVIAQAPCTVLILDRAFISYLIDHDVNVRYGYIAFLATKTLYLNQKIACLTAGSAEKRLAFWLDAQATGDLVILEVSMTALCTMLDMGRASLYRAFDQLESDGFIKREGKTVRLYRRDDMLSFYH